jgi:hypothetical protein
MVFPFSELRDRTLARERSGILRVMLGYNAALTSFDDTDTIDGSGSCVISMDTTLHHLRVAH